MKYMMQSVAAVARRKAAGGGVLLGWESPVAISTVGDTIVSTEGTMLEAVNLGEATNKTVNGVSFTGQVSKNDLAAGYYDVNNYQDGGVGTAFQEMLDSFAYDSDTSGTITLSGLTNGVTYLLQVFVTDDRGFGAVTQTMTVGAYSSTPTLQSASFSAICRFVASGTSQVVALSTDTGVPVINGFQVRTL
jgi:hypothetical protein